MSSIQPSPGILIQERHLVLPALVYTVLFFYCFRFLVDDTYIHFLVSRNLVEHGILSSTLDKPVLATTAFVHALIGAVFYAALGPDLVEYGVKLLGWMLGLAALVIVNANLALWGVFRKGRLLACCFLATSFPWILWTAGAMETIYVGFVALFACWMFSRAIQGRGRPEAFLLAAAACVFFRLDTALFAAVLVGALLWRERFSRSALLRSAWFFALPIALLLGALVVYYGSAVPTPAAKGSFSIRAVLENLLGYGPRYFLDFCLLNLNFVAVIAALAFAFSRARKFLAHTLDEIDYAAFSIAAALGVYLLYIMSQGNVHMMFAFRFYTPMVPLLALLLGKGLPERLLGRFGAPAIAITLLFNSLTFFYGYYVSLGFSRISGGDMTGSVNHNIRGWTLLHESMKETGRYFGELLPKDASVLLGVAGIIPYYLQQRAYDNLLIGKPPSRAHLDFALDGCHSTNPVPAGIWRHPVKPVDPDMLYYPISSWCVMQLPGSRLASINPANPSKSLVDLPISNIAGFERIMDMAGDLSCNFYVEGRNYDELARVIGKMSGFSDTTSARRFLKGYGPLLPEATRQRLQSKLPDSP